MVGIGGGVLSTLHFKSEFYGTLNKSSVKYSLKLSTMVGENFPICLPLKFHLNYQPWLEKEIPTGNTHGKYPRDLRGARDLLH